MSPGWKRAAGLRFALAFVALNVPHWLVGHWYFVSRPIFDVELVVPLLLAAYSLSLGVFSLLIAWGLDLLVSQSYAYHFASPLEFIRSIKYLGSIQVSHLVTPAELLWTIPFIASAVLAFRMTPRQRPASWLAAALLVACLSTLDIANGSSMFSHRPSQFAAVNIAGSPVTTLIARKMLEKGSAVLTPLGKGDSAVQRADLLGWMSQHPRDGAMLVIVESMGWHRDVRIREWLKDRLFSGTIAKRYAYDEAAIPFNGSTTSAELRELCSYHGSYQALLSGRDPECLPRRLQADGFRTIGLHGFSGHMFDRNLWWRSLGLQQEFFAEQLSTLPRCGGAFAGICDTDVIHRAFAELAKERTFVYVLTLNSHLPLSAEPIPSDLAGICAAVRTGEGVCQLTATLGKALAAIGNELNAMDTGTAVVVVGDHPPPFRTFEESVQYDSRSVPAMVLKATTTVDSTVSVTPNK